MVCHEGKSNCVLNCFVVEHCALIYYVFFHECLVESFLFYNKNRKPSTVKLGRKEKVNYHSLYEIIIQFYNLTLGRLLERLYIMYETERWQSLKQTQRGSGFVQHSWLFGKSLKSPRLMGQGVSGG